VRTDDGLPYVEKWTIGDKISVDFVEPSQLVKSFCGSGYAQPYAVFREKKVKCVNGSTKTPVCPIVRI
jgi:hypothetical protein